ncbi:MAG: selenocysteine-specific translation elongation factor [Thermoanaerobaculia bacterium]
MRRVIVGTAGHIDHGKTRLVEALTGIDCDRWAEEKSRGITIDLGFAHLEANDFQIGFVDVPGHERFLHNALAGLGGIRLVLLVVAADEGVKPQTSEHLAICTLLAIPACLVALTKRDLVSPDLLELARLEVEELLASTPYTGAPVVGVSSVTGEGVAELHAELLELAERHQATVDPERPARLPVDRAFHLKGLGVVVTGTLISGAVQAGDQLTLLPAGRAARVRSVQVHGSSRDGAEAGERTALQLTGPDLGALARGVQLATPNRFEPTTRLLGRFTLLRDAPKPTKGSTPIRFHLYASEVQGRLRPLSGPLEPGDTGPVEIRLAHPVVAVRGDRFVVRRPSPPATLGGGEILDSRWLRRRGKPLTAALEALSGETEEALLLWIEEAGEAGVGSEALARRLGRQPGSIAKALKALSGEQKILRVPPGQGHGERWLTPAAYRRVASRAAKALKTYFREHRLARGMPKAEAVDRLLPRRASELADVYLDWLQAQKVLVVQGDRVNLPGRSAELTPEESRLERRILEAYEAAGLEPPAPSSLRDELQAKPQILQGVLRYLLERGKLARLSGGLVIAASAIDRVSGELRSSDWDRFSVGDFKKRYGLTRKWAIPILEHLDSKGVTRRVGDQRMVLRR